MPPDSWLTNALSILRQGKSLVVARVIGPSGHPWFGQNLIWDPVGSSGHREDALPVSNPESWTKALRETLDGRLALTKSFQVQDSTQGSATSEVKVFMTWCGPPPEAWVFGAGHIGQALSPLLSRLGWRVIVCDDRPEFLSPAHFPDAHECRSGDFTNSAQVCARRPDAWVVLVTRGHQHDEQILRALRFGEARYVGMIGSKRRVATVHQRMIAEGASKAFLESLHAPIGLPIGADSPMEIAVSIAAEMIAVRRGAVLSTAPAKTDQACPADSLGLLEVWQRVAAVVESGKPAILATVVSRRGSTPRGLGAQMAVFADGSACGTIGGGCGEGVVLRAAKELLMTGGAHRVVEVDLTGDDAAESADVCGGHYSVFLECLI